MPKINDLQAMVTVQVGKDEVVWHQVEVDNALSVDEGQTM
jgi:hypothetical protein